MTPMPYFSQVGSTSASMPRTRIEYGGCSVEKRPRPRVSAVHCASTIWCAGYVDEPKARILPWRCRSVSTDRVSSSVVSGSGRWIW